MLKEIPKKNFIGVVKINKPAKINADLSMAVQPRARGDVDLTISRRADQNALKDLRQSGSFKALFPRTSPESLQAVLVNTAGGVTGGDRFSVKARAESGANLTVTTQAAERAYRANSGELGRLNNDLVIGSNARLNWLPQETILFDGCAISRSTTVNMAKSSSLLLAEPLVFGRLAMGEQLSRGFFRDRLEIIRDDECVFLDSMLLSGDITAHLARPNIANDLCALASILYVSTDAEAMLPKIRTLLPETGGASLIHDDALFVRALALDSFLLRKFLVPILNLLSNDTLPRAWMI